MPAFYILDGKMVIQADSFLEWAQWMQTKDHRVAFTEINGVVISTVFLGVDHNFCGDGDPLLFETMVFSPDWERGEQRRYFTWQEAQVGHQEVVEAIKTQSAEIDHIAIETILKIMAKT